MRMETISSLAMESNEITHDLRGYSYEDRQGLLPGLTEALVDAGGWLLERKTTSATTMELRVEIQLHGIVELYAALVAAGIELTRATHAVLTELCTCRRHIAGGSRAGQVVTLSLELSFLEDASLTSLLMTGCGMA